MQRSRFEPLPRLLVLAALVTGCADGDDAGSGSFGNTNLTYTSVPPATTPMGTDATDDAGVVTEGDTGGEDTTDDPPASSTSGDPSTTAVDPSTTAPDPSTTAPDPSTTAPDPSTTEPDPSTTNMTTMPMTTQPMTTDPDPNNPDQPTAGKLYAECLEPEECVSPNACLTVTDSMTNMVYDGYCTRLCDTVNDCGVAPAVPAVQKCVPFDTDVNLCMLECFDSSDCPNGMECTGVSNPNMTEGNYCI